VVTPSTASPSGGSDRSAVPADRAVTEMSSAVHLIEAALLTVADLPSSRSVGRTDTGADRVRRRYLHMYVPERWLPAYVLLVGRRLCCGVRWGTTHLFGCSGRASTPPLQAVAMPRNLLDRLP
jgi:hypothetical protein